MTALATPSPYLRDRLLQAADGLRKDAEHARLSLATAEQDVAAALALLDEARQVLAEAEAHRDRAQAAVDGITHDIAWCEQQAAERTAPAYDPDAALAATGLLAHEEPEQATDLAPYFGEDVVIRTFGGHRIAGHLEAHGSAARVRQPDGQDCYVSPATIAEIKRVTVIDPPPGFDPSAPLVVTHDPDDLTAPGVADSRAQIAPHLPLPVPHEPAGPDATHCPTCESPEPSLHPAVSGGGEVTHICDDPFHGPVPQDPAGQPVATHGPTVTMPDTGLNPDPLPPAPPTAEPRHAKPADRPGLLARLTGGHRIVPEQDGDDRG